MMRQTTVIILLLALALSLTLFTVKYRVQDLEQELASLDRSIVKDRQEIQVLKAEWSLLNAPDRLRVLSSRYLGMEPLTQRQISSIENLPARSPAITKARVER